MGVRANPRSRIRQGKKSLRARIVPVPAKASSVDATWSKLEALGIRETDVVGAVRWARRRKPAR